jgi:HSP20 family protein
VRINEEVSLANTAVEISDWIALHSGLRAPADLFHPWHLEIEEATDSVATRVEVPGFNAHQLQIHVDPRRATITGKRDTQDERGRGKVTYADHCADQIYRVVDLPAQVDVSRATARVINGALELGSPKVAEARLSRAATQAS